jgi:two-component system NtrC family sensor kinase
MAKRKPTIHKASAGRKPSSKRAPPSKTVRAIADLRRKNAQLTRELSKALDRQIATGDVLKVISRSTFDLQAVLQMLTETAARLCDADMASIARQDEAGFYQATNYNFPPDWVEYSRAFRTFAGRGSISGRALLDGKAVQVADVEADSEYTYQEQQKKSGYRTFLAVPLLRNGQPVVLLNLARTSVRPFTEKQIELVSTFADQAVIAIENARLFNEVQARTNDLSESLQQQTATAEILSVISSSPGDLAPVFEAMLSKAMNLCGANFGVLNTFDGKSFHTGATYGLPPAYDEFRRNRTLEYGPGTAPARLLEGEPYVEFVDLLDSEAYRAGEPNRRALVDLGGARSLLAVPLLKDERVVGSVMIFRQEPQRFSDKQIALLKQFAAQAVIAIENARLLNELRESLQQQTATADVLRVISASPGEPEPVFQAMLENAVRLCEAKFAMLFLYEENQFRAVAKWNIPPAYGEFLEKNTILADPKVPLGRVAITKQPVQVEDVLLDQSYIEGFPGMVGVAEDGGARTLLQVPMLKENELVGTIGIYRQVVRPFTDKQIALMQNFAAQAVIAIENARLLNELRQRTDDLTASLEDLRTAQDRLVQTEKLASLGQLTAGIAHEIKNPLNFVNNFAALSAELTDELNDVLKPAAISEKIRNEVDELTGLLKDNLGKVVQHGKRADSIVKNMLLHSREGSGEHRSADINALVEECLNLAYHGARAEKSGFSITFKRDLDPDAGAAEVYPQEVTRALLNLISNGFYAATKRKSEADDETFEPALSATTRSLGDRVEIRIRDNGAGIPPEVREKIFNPFFTTKPAGEGTGLGLSMSHDIIVKQHGGSINVETERGVFTEFIITLPRGDTASDSKPE